MTKYIIANWKSNKTLAQTKDWVEKFLQSRDSIQDISHTTNVIMPSFHTLHAVQSILGPHITLGVQDISPFSAGAYTGAIAGSLLTGLGVQYALVGHSERRRHFQESYVQVAQKIDQCVQNNITPIVCLDVPDIEPQVRVVAPEQLSRCLVAYEPLSAIGSGISQDTKTVGAVISSIKELYADVPVLYGGSVTSQDILEYTLISDGVLIGSASLEAQEYVCCIEKVASATTPHVS